MKMDTCNEVTCLDYQAIGQRIRALRKSQGLTQEQLAEAASLSPPFVSHIERAVKLPSLHSLFAIAGVLGVGLDQLVGIHSSDSQNIFYPAFQAVLLDCTPNEQAMLLEFICAAKGILRVHLQAGT